MTLDLSILLTVISVSFAVLLGVLGLRRNNKQDDQKEATLLAVMNATLDRVAKDVTDIKTEVRDVRCEVKAHSERIIKVEEQVKVLNKNVFTDKKGA